jgi:hypothetical protein
MDMYTKKGGDKVARVCRYLYTCPWIMLNEQHIMACTSTKLNVLECKIPHELDALKWKAIGGGGDVYQKVLTKLVFIIYLLNIGEGKKKKETNE